MPLYYSNNISKYLIEFLFCTSTSHDTHYDEIFLKCIGYSKDLDCLQVFALGVMEFICLSPLFANMEMSPCIADSKELQI